MLLQLEAKKYAFPRDFLNHISYFFFSETRKKDYQRPFNSLVLDHLREINDCFNNIPPEQWSISSLNQVIEALNEILSNCREADSAESNDMGKAIKSQLQAFLRWSVSYGHPGPTIAQTMEILGRDVTIGRLRDAIVSLKNPIQESGALAPP